MAKRLTDFIKPPKGSAREKDSSYMKERWKDPAYREKVSNIMKEKWKDPAYRAMQKHAAVNPAHRATIAVHVADRCVKWAARLRLEIKLMSEDAATLEYHAKVIYEGGDPTRVLEMGSVTNNIMKKYYALRKSYRLEDLHKCYDPEKEREKQRIRAEGSEKAGEAAGGTGSTDA